jgi:uncharacterized membrane protein YgcG
MRRGRLAAACLVLGALAAVWLTASSPSASAQASEQIHTYDVDLAIQSDGSLLVTERIDYDFGDVPHHGIFRDIPNRLVWDEKFDRIYPIHVLDVVGSPGTPDGYKIEHPSGLFRIKIGDAKKTITGEHLYTLTYRVEGALNGFPDHDELNWNAVGVEWFVPIGQATVRVTGPVAFGQVACFAGPFRSDLPCSEATVSGSTATFRQTQQEPLPWALGPQEGLTIVVGFPKGAVPDPKPILDERWAIQRAFSITPVTVSAAGFLLLLAVGGVVYLMWRTGRDRRAMGSPVDVLYATSAGGEQAVPLFERGVAPVEFAPPEGLRPGQVGTLLDEQANPLDVTATIVDLAVRGYLRIEEIPKKGLFGKTDWWLVKLKEEDDHMLRYETLLFTGLFAGVDDDADEDDEDVEVESDEALVGNPAPDRPDMPRLAAPPGPELGRVKLSSLRKHFYKRMAHVQEALYADATRRKWFAGRPDKVRTRWTGLGWVAFVAGTGVMVLLAWLTHAALVAVPLALAGLLLIWGAHLMPRRTPLGTGLARRVLGFRTYIETAESREARFDEQENLFSKYLPYAVVFGCTEKWARAFGPLAEQAAATAGWYVGAHPFTIASFSSSIDQFAVSSAGTITSRPSGSGSSGFGGGGFSGGGGGGGGGGSW